MTAASNRTMSTYYQRRELIFNAKKKAPNEGAGLKRGLAETGQKSGEGKNFRTWHTPAIVLFSLQQQFFLLDKESCRFCSEDRALSQLQLLRVVVVPYKDLLVIIWREVYSRPWLCQTKKDPFGSFFVLFI